MERLGFKTKLALGAIGAFLIMEAESTWHIVRPMNETIETVTYHPKRALVEGLGMFLRWADPGPTSPKFPWEKR